MDIKEQLKKINEETMSFMRVNYILDEVSNGKDELKFKHGKRTILTIYTRESVFDFLVIFGKLEREKFEAQRETFSERICTVYDNSKTYHDGKWMMFSVDSLEMLDEVKKLVLIKKKPNRKTLFKDNTISK